MNTHFFRTLFAVTAFVSFAAQAQLSLRDDLNRPILVKKPATRIVSLAPFLTETVFAAGAGELMVGVDNQSDYPAEVARLPRLSIGAGFAVEQLVKLKPDLVLAWKDGIRKEDVDRITAFGATVYVAQARQLDDVPRLLRVVGALTGRDVDMAVNDFHSRLEALRRANAFKAQLRTFLEIWNRPITTVSGDHFLNEALDICRAENIFRELKAVAPKVTYEEIAERNPFLIVGASSASNADEFRANWRLRPGLEAVKANRMVFVDAESIQRPTPRTPEGIAMLCAEIDRVRASPQGLPLEPSRASATEPAPSVLRDRSVPLPSLQLSPVLPPSRPAAAPPAPAAAPATPQQASPPSPPPAAPEPTDRPKRPSQYGM